MLLGDTLWLAVVVCDAEPVTLGVPEPLCVWLAEPVGLGVRL